MFVKSKLSIYAFAVVATMSFFHSAFAAPLELKAGKYRITLASRGLSISSLEFDGTRLGNSIKSMFCPEKGVFVREGSKNSKLLSAKLTVDGKVIDKPAGKYTGENLVLERTYQMNNLKISSSFKLTNKELVIASSWEVLAEQPMVLFYLYSCNWNKINDQWCAWYNNDVFGTGNFVGENKFYLTRNPNSIKWFALFASSEKKGIVGVLNDNAVNSGSSRFWDRPTSRVLIYDLRIPEKRIIKKKSPVCSLSLRGFNADAKDWKKKAKEAAGSLIKD